MTEWSPEICTKGNFDPYDPRVVFAISALLIGEDYETVVEMLVDSGVPAPLAHKIVNSTKPRVDRFRAGTNGD